MPPARPRRTATALALPALATVGVLLLAACSSGGGSGTTAQQDDGESAQQAPQMTGRQGGGTSGEIVAIDGTVLQLRSSDSQTAVTWTDTTTVTRTVAAALADVTVGSCVSTTTAPTGDDAQADDSGPASTVRITAAADDGTCGFGGLGGGPGGDRPDFSGGEGSPGGPQGTRPTDLPDGAPTDFPSGAPAFMGGSGGFSSGKVTAVDGSTITIEQTRPQPPSQDGSTSSPSSDDTTTSTVTVTVDASTTYTKDAVADTSAIAVGLCAVARGEADDSGKVTATALMLSDKGADGCTSGFMMRGTRPGGTGGSGTDQTQGGTDA
ncbi:hypothetical protein [Cellulomonas sp.]|uniref:hypothetical protein n=1 Tax=Cellulomonas sp. TaxID=40001 RepID=UPI001B2B2C30|nr:hypothetical protein [Cellulomonas sp.]MBO9555438.1 hypothetical protein [Cellulomonas sp.]